MEALSPLALSLLIYVTLCMVGAAAGLAILRFTVPEMSLFHRLLLAPVTTMALWAVALGLGVAFGVRVRLLAGPIWVITIGLAVMGLWNHGGGGSPPLTRAERAVLALCLMVPVGLLPGYFRHGLANYPGSPYEDGWSYVAFGQYLWADPRVRLKEPDARQAASGPDL